MVITRLVSPAKLHGRWYKINRIDRSRLGGCVVVGFFVMAHPLVSLKRLDAKTLKYFENDNVCIVDDNVFIISFSR